MRLGVLALLQRAPALACPEAVASRSSRTVEITVVLQNDHLTTLKSRGIGLDPPAIRTAYLDGTVMIRLLCGILYDY